MSTEIETVIYAFLFDLVRRTEWLLSGSFKAADYMYMLPFPLFLSFLVINRMVSPRALLMLALLFTAGPLAYWLLATEDIYSNPFRPDLPSAAIYTVLLTALVVPAAITFWRKVAGPGRVGGKPLRLMHVTFLISGIVLLWAGSVFFGGRYAWADFADYQTYPLQWMAQKASYTVFLLAFTVFVPSAIGAVPRRGYWRIPYRAMVSCYTAAAGYIGYLYGNSAFFLLISWFQSLTVRPFTG